MIDLSSTGVARHSFRHSLCDYPSRMEAELARLRQLLEESKRELSAERKQREEAERITRPQTFQEYLESCHKVDLAIKVITNPLTTTQGITADPTGRIYPLRIVPSPDFVAKQLEIWDLLAESDAFLSETIFPSPHQIEYVQSVQQAVSSEMSLRHFERDVVENAVKKMIDCAYNDPLLRNKLELLGNVTFESHTNLDDYYSNPSFTENVTAQTSVSTRRSGPSSSRASSDRPVLPKLRGKGGVADNFCIYRRADGRDVPALAIEYKAPHKLFVDEIVTGLESEIQPDRDVINKEGDDFVFASKSLTAAVITQLFSYMVAMGIQYGYVCTGQAFVFLYIPDDPTTVHYSVCVPSQDVAADGETGLHRTAVAQVFAFILRALRAKPPSMAWFDQAAKLNTWVVEYDDILSKIPATVRKEKRASPYRPSSWKGRIRSSPIMTRSRCKPAESGPPKSHDGDGDNRGGRHNRNHSDGGNDGNGSDGGQGSDSSDSYNPPSPSPNQGRTTRDAEQAHQAGECIEKRPYCTQECLLGLLRGGPLDEQCPNIHHHGSEHIGRREFLRLIRIQLATERDENADCVPLSLSGAIGALFKVRLSSHGYTLVAKGVETPRIHRLRHERGLYKRLAAIQGKHVPVCLGIAHLDLPWYFNGGIYEHFLFLGWAGHPLRECITSDNQAFFVDAITTAFKEMHQLRVLHCDAEPRNMLYDAERKTVMVVDFERAVYHEFQGRQDSADTYGSKHKRLRRLDDDSFTKELKYVGQRVWDICESVNNPNVKIPPRRPLGTMF